MTPAREPRPAPPVGDRADRLRRAPRRAHAREAVPREDSRWTRRPGTRTETARPRCRASAWTRDGVERAHVEAVDVLLVGGDEDEPAPVGRERHRVAERRPLRGADLELHDARVAAAGRERAARAPPRRPRTRPQSPRGERRERLLAPSLTIRRQRFDLQWGSATAVFSSKGNWPEELGRRGELFEVQPRVRDVVEALLRLPPQTPSKNLSYSSPASAAGRAAQSGSPRRIAASVSDTVSPSKARLPASIS